MRVVDRHATACEPTCLQPVANTFGKIKNILSCTRTADVWPMCVQPDDKYLKIIIKLHTDGGHAIARD